MSFQVVQPGTFSILVDSGRPRHRSLGIPVGGAADRAAWQIGNALIGNSPNAVALEITLSGPALQALADIDVCIYGAPFRVELDGIARQVGSTISVQSGQRLSIGGTPRGVRGYLCVAGGFEAKEVLGSRTGFAPIQAGETLNCRSCAGRRRSLEQCDARELLEIAAQSADIRVLAGPQLSWFGNCAFFEQSFQVSTASNRMGIRLQSSALVRSAREMISEAVAPGAIQVTNDGQCIILCVDGQTIGGYPKIAHVIRADLDLLAQLRPGQMIHFSEVTMEEAEEIGVRHDRRLESWLKRLELPA
jgi:antagonist of KipI